MSSSDPAWRAETSALLAGYGANPAVPDEMLDPAGALRPAWRDLLRYLESLPVEAVGARFRRGDQYLRDAGVFYRHYGKGEVAVRDWPLSHIPVVIAEQEWQTLAAGLIQRANLLEAVVADLYGENRLVANGDIPAMLIGTNPHWLRPMVGVKPASGYFLHAIAMELGRGPDGRWWVLSDRTEAPSGAGFALENRVATARVFADIYRSCNVHRLAGFFSNFKGLLDDLQGRDAGRPAILTPGPYNETYSEQAYIARYLGLSLLEGEDLVVEHDRLMVRTIAGPRPISVLWRRLDSGWCDPLDLNEQSRLGVPGLMDAMRAGHLTMINAPGAGVLETQALLAFLPALSQKLTGAPLAIPNIATWWCGGEAEFRHVRANAGRMIIGPALANRMTVEQDSGSAIDRLPGGVASGHSALGHEALRPDLIGQELATLSTTPVWVDGRLQPRPVSIRVFLARTRQGWVVMPGGFARLGSRDDPAAITMWRGGSVADVWIVSDRPVAEVSLLDRDSHAFQRAAPSSMPSRAADNLFWLGRYVERAEGLCRLLRAHHSRLAESGGLDAPIIALTERILDRYGIDPAVPVPPQVAGVIDSAMTSANHVRDRFSMDGWAALADLSSAAKSFGESVAPGDDAARAYGILIRKLTGFSGLVHENMVRSVGWRFLSIGKALERSLAMADLIAALMEGEAVDGAFDLAVEIGDSIMTHRRRYSVATRRDSVVDLLVLDPLNPRAILYEIDQVQEHASVLPGFSENGQLSALARAILTLRTMLATALPGQMSAATLIAIRDEIAGISEHLTNAYLR